MKELKLIETVYDLSMDGTLTKKRTGKVLAKPISTKGYINYNISIEGKKFNVLGHRLVAAKYIPNPENLPHINHINGVKTDNRVDNLEWCTPKHNNQHMHDTKLWKSTKAHKAAVTENLKKGQPKAWEANTKFDDACIEQFISMKEEGLSLREIGRRMGTSHTTVSAAIKRYKGMK